MAGQTDAETVTPAQGSTSSAADGLLPPEAASSSAAALHPLSRLFDPVDLMPLACFRIFFGAMMVYHVATYVIGGWVNVFYVVPQFHFTYPGFGWVTPWPGQGMMIHFAVMGLAAVGIMTGCLYRISAAMFAFCFTYVFLLEKSLYQNHYYLICLLSFLMVFVPAHRMWSVDAARNARIRSQTAPALWLWTIRMQLAIPYIYGGIAKINSDWLNGMPMRMWLERRTWLPGVGPWLDTDFAVYGLAWGGMLFDLLVVPALFWKRTRVPAFIAALGFHLANSVLWTIGIFPWFMIGATVLFFPADSLRRSIFRRSVRRPPAGEQPQVWSRRQRLFVLTLGLFMTWQLLFPFRHFLYPGNTSWTEEAQLFSWHMMLREKKVGIRFYLLDPKTKTKGILDVNGFLHPRQIAALGKDPDMILEFTHYVRDFYRRTEQTDVRINVVALASLNGRKPQLLIDPILDYAQVERVWGHQPWIVPLHEPLRREAWNLPVDQWESELSSLITDFKSPTSTE